MNLEYGDIFTYTYQIQISPAQEGVSLLASEIREGYPLSLRQKLPKPIEKDDSPWLVFSLMYKPNRRAREPTPNTNSLGFRDEEVILP